MNGKRNNDNISVNGGWSDWEAWSGCSADCGPGTREKTRACTNPAPSNGGADCTGEITESEACNKEDCPGKNKAYIIYDTSLANHVRTLV